MASKTILTPEKIVKSFKDTFKTKILDARVEKHIRGIKKNGDVIWFDQHSRQITYNGKSAILTNIIDVTDQKKAEQELENTIMFSDSVIDSLPGIFYMFNMKMKFLRWNKNLEVISGYSKDEIAKMSPLHFFSGEEVNSYSIKEVLKYYGKLRG